MARRGSSVGDFLRNFGASYNLFSQISKEQELAKLAKENDVEAFSADQGKELEAITNAKDENGKPYYAVTASQDGKYQVAPNFKQADGADASTATIAPKGAAFLGTNYEAPLTDQQRVSARRQAQAGVLEKYGDLEGASRMRAQNRAEELSDLHIAEAKARQRMLPMQEEVAQLGLDNARRSNAAAKRADSVDSTVAADWDKRLTLPDGTKRAPTDEDHIWMTQRRAFALTDAGDLRGAAEAYQQHAQQTKMKIEAETAVRSAAVDQAMAGLARGDFSGVKTVYNKFMPDGMTVTDISQGKDGKIVIEREDASGKKLPSQTVESMDKLRVGVQSVADPIKAWQMSQQLFANALKARETAAHERTAAASVGARAEAAAAAKRQADAAADYYKQQNPSATAVDLKAVREGVLSAVPTAGKNDPADLTMAKAALNARVPGVTDMATALEWARGKKEKTPGELHAEFVSSGLKNMASPEQAVATADKTMGAMGFAKNGGRWGSAAPARGAFASVAEAEAAARDGKIKKGDTITVNGRRAVWE